MGVQQQKIQEVHPRDFCVMFTGVTVFVAAREAYYLCVAQPIIPPQWLVTTFLITVWWTFAAGAFRHKNYPVLPYGLALTGYTLCLSDQLFPLATPVISAMQAGGLLLTGVAVIVTIVSAFPLRRRG